MNRKQKILIVGAALFAALFLFSGAMLYHEYTDSQQSALAFETLAKLVVDTPEVTIPAENTESDSNEDDTTSEPISQPTAVESMQRFMSRTVILWAGSALTVQISTTRSCNPRIILTSI